MADQRRGGISWTDDTWNPIRGCSRVSPGCGGPQGQGGCYAERFAIRLSGSGQSYEGLVRSTSNGPRWTGEVRFVEDALNLPLRWKKPRRIFVNSMSDLFHEKVPDEWIDRIFAVMALAPQHTFQVLTKRPERMRAYLEQVSDERDMQRWARWADIAKSPCAAGIFDELDWPIANAHLGVSVEDQPTADARIPLLLQTPAAVRFVSYEPALGPVDFGKINGRTSTRVHDSGRMDVLRGIAVYPTTHPEYPEQGYPMQPLDWLIVGCESGPNRRNQDGYEACARAAIQQAQAAGVRVFHKQMPIKGRVSHDPSEWPEDLRVREWPR